MTHKTRKDLHAILAATSGAGILEMAGGADCTNSLITMAVIMFSYSLAVNAYAWMALDGELVSGEDEAVAFWRSEMGGALLVGGSSGVCLGFNFVMLYFSLIAGITWTIFLVGMVSYHLRIRTPNHLALGIWREHETQEARLEAWLARTRLAEKDFDRAVARLRKRGRLTKEPESGAKGHAPRTSSSRRKSFVYCTLCR